MAFHSTQILEQYLVAGINSSDWVFRKTDSNDLIRIKFERYMRRIQTEEEEDNNHDDLEYEDVLISLTLETDFGGPINGILEFCDSSGNPLDIANPDVYFDASSSRTRSFRFAISYHYMKSQMISDGNSFYCFNLDLTYQDQENQVEDREENQEEDQEENQEEDQEEIQEETQAKIQAEYQAEAQLEPELEQPPLEPEFDDGQHKPKKKSVVKAKKSDKSDKSVGDSSDQIVQFSGYQKLKEILSKSSEAEGFRNMANLMKIQISAAEESMQKLPEQISAMETEMAGLLVKQKELTNRKTNSESHALQSLISEMEQKNYVLDRKIRTHQVISLADQEAVNKLLGVDLADLTPEQGRLLIYNFSILRKRILEEMGENHLCLICMENRREVVTDPCGHLSLCHECAGDLSCHESRACPKCTRPFSRTIQVRY